MTTARRGEVKELGPGGVQSYLKEQVALWGGMAEHFTSPGKTGVEDFIVTWPASGWGRVHFVECKCIGGKLSPRQKIVQAERRAFQVYSKNLWTKNMVDEYVREFGRVPLTVV